MSEPTTNAAAGYGSGRIDGGEHRFPVRVYFEDTDAGGIVYHATYLHFAERARTELLRVFGFSQAALRHEAGVLFLVRACALAFHRPAHLDELLEVRTKLLDHSRSSFRMWQAIAGSDEVAPRVTVDVRLVTVDAAAGRPTRIPPEIAAHFATIRTDGAPPPGGRTESS